MEISKERAEELTAAWEAASATERLRLNRVEWVSVGDSTSYFELSPSPLEIKAADRIAELEADLASLEADLKEKGLMVVRIPLPKVSIQPGGAGKLRAAFKL